MLVEIYIYVIFLSAVAKNVQCYSDIVIYGNETKHRNFVYNTYKYDSIIDLTVNDTTEQILDFEESSNKWHGYPSRVHVRSHDDINETYPLFITALQQKGVSSWELPLAVRDLQFKDMARTLCPHDAGPNITSVNRPLIQVSTKRPYNTSVQIKVRRVHDFFVEVEKDVNVTATPSAPKYYYFSFDSNPFNHPKNGPLQSFNYTVPKSVILMIESDDDICAVVSIQNNSCPVFDNEQDIKYQGYYLTMTNRGGITLTQTMFPVGFYIVFIVKQSDEECTGVSETALTDSSLSDTYDEYTKLKQDGRIKKFRLRVMATISYWEYVVGALVMLALVVLTAIFVALLSLFALLHQRNHHAETLVEAEPSTSAVSEDTPIIHNEPDKEQADALSVASSMSEGVRSLGATGTVAGLSRARQVHHNRRSDRYFWNALTVAVVYALPVAQLLLTYQHIVFQTGNQDLCYYNFLCAHPLMNLSDFNHVYSNVGYVVLGAVFLLMVRRRQVTKAHLQDTGIPQHHGIFYSMGVALIMEGLLSACYHLCPNKMNFQFDSSFMYVIAVLCMVKLYQNRHPDVNANAHSTFMLIAVIMLLGVIGIMYPSVYFWVLLTALHLLTCAVLTLKMYYVGQFKLGRSVLPRAYASLRTGGARALVPRYRLRAALLATAVVVNLALAIYGMYNHNKDVARHLLAILLGNTVLYTLFYVIMKLVHRERIYIHTWLYCLFAHIAWFTALKLFLQSNTKWSETPAQSRRHNSVCLALQFYDTHDLWHLLSAAALFLSFSMLLTVDDALQHTPRDQIPVF